MGVGALLSGGLAQLWRTALAWLRLRCESPHIILPVCPLLGVERAAGQLAEFGCSCLVPHH